MSELEVLGAYDRKPIATLGRQSWKEVDAFLDKAWNLHRDRRKWLPKSERIAILTRAAELVRERQDELALQAAREGGKPLIDSRVELARAVAGIETAVHELSHFGGTQIPMGLNQKSEGYLAYTYRDPRGIVGAISAFNHPFNLIVHQAIPAVATGCPVIVKPASSTPLSCKALIDILHEAGLPKEWGRTALLDTESATKLASDPRLGFFSFIGSYKVGWMLRSKLGPGVGCAMEHGGVAPTVVEADADLDAAIPALVKGGYYHAGQVCVSVQRIFVHRSIQQSFVERFVEEVKKLKVGDPTDETTEVGPLIEPKEVTRVGEWVDEAVKGGGKLLCGGKQLSETTYEPTVVFDPPRDCRLSQDEVFGPVVAIYPYDDLDDAIARANEPDVFFQASIFTKNLDVALDAARRLDGMAVMINEHTAFRVDWMPFGGHRNSGLNAGGIGYSMHDMTLERMIVIKSPVL